jgi:hypothetical protein
MKWPYQQRGFHSPSESNENKFHYNSSSSLSPSKVVAISSARTCAQVINSPTTSSTFGY